MSTGKTGTRYDEEFKHTLVNLYQSGGKSQATLKQRLEAIHKLRFQHGINILCKVLGVNRSTYYKHYSSKPAGRTKENQELAKLILQIYADYNKRLGAYKIAYVLQRDYGINISVGQVYRLMKTLQLPRMSTDKPYKNYRHKDNGDYTNHLHQEFNQKAPNLVWTSDFTYIQVAGK